MAPARKIDPGELFPWGGWRWRASGFGRRRASTGSTVPFEDGLRAFGYGLRPDMDVPKETVIQAFQRHFRPAKIDGVADEECKRILAALLGSRD